MSEAVDEGVVPKGGPCSQRRFTVRGRVQGVGFRWWTQREACARNLVGSVWNRDDGAVEIVAGGEAFSLEAFADRLREGPPAARVDAIDVQTVVTACTPLPTSFEIVRTP